MCISLYIVCCLLSYHHHHLVPLLIITVIISSVFTIVTFSFFWCKGTCALFWSTTYQKKKKKKKNRRRNFTVGHSLILTYSIAFHLLFVLLSHGPVSKLHSSEDLIKGPRWPQPRCCVPRAVWCHASATYYARWVKSPFSWLLSHITRLVLTALSAQSGRVHWHQPQLKVGGFCLLWSRAENGRTHSL